MKTFLGFYEGRTTAHGYKPRWGQKVVIAKPVHHIQHTEPDKSHEEEEQRKYQEWLQKLKEKHPNPKYTMDYRKKIKEDVVDKTIIHPDFVVGKKEDDAHVNHYQKGHPQKDMKFTVHVYDHKHHEHNMFHVVDKDKAKEIYDHFINKGYKDTEWSTFRVMKKF